MRKSKKMFLKTHSAVALYHREVVEQLSDGRWENTRPHGHWRFWCSLDAEMLPERAGEVDCGDERCLKNAYDVVSLMNLKKKYDQGRDGEYVLRDRMLKIGRMGKAGYTPLRTASEYMPDTYEEWANRKAAGDWQYDFVKEYMSDITDEMARGYYATSYTVDELRADLKHIKETMKQALRW